MKKLSIIVPNYNASKYLNICLHSLVNQTLKDKYEIIVIDDASTDNSLEIIKYFQNNYPHLINLIKLDEHMGVSFARNKGLDVANGKYIGFVDADDVVAINMYEDILNIATNLNVQVVTTDFDRITEYEYLDYLFKTSELKKVKKINLIKNKKFFKEEAPSIWNKIYHHDLINDTKFLNGKIFEDVAFNYPLLLKAEKIAFVDRLDYKYRITPNGIMDKSFKDSNKQILDIFEIVSYTLELGESWNFDEKKMALLYLKMQDIILEKIKIINSWNICDIEKKEIMKNVLALYRHLFNDYKHLNLSYLKLSKKIEEKKINNYQEWLSVLKESRELISEVEFKRTLRY